MPALCAVSTAWCDWQSKKNRMPLYKYLNIDPPSKKKSSITISVGDDEALRERLESGFKHVKIKMDADDTQNDQLIGVINNSENAHFRIDANGSWSYDKAERIISAFSLEKVELIEQPFLPEAVDDWVRFRENYRIPLFMDESISNVDDVKRSAGYVDGVNIKIQKSGLLETAVEAIRTAQELGLKIMLGCMIESSVGIAAAYHLSARADYLDLDGRLLIEDDPFTGLTYDKAKIIIGNDLGHGVSFA
jgi:L-alanine-DL-glutamate epimerase-like enolase superfamily enzyme